MATISLEIGETFEHYHATESFTQHVVGSLELSYNDESYVLLDSETIKVPAQTSHTVKNVGMMVAVFKCYNHESDPDPGPTINPNP